MRTVSDIQKPSLEEALEHYGVLGMKWGVRRSDEELSRAKKKKALKKAKAELTPSEIKDARVRDAGRVRKLNRQIDAVNLAEEGKEQARELEKLEQMSIERLKHPDAANALRMTDGEKAAHVALAVLLPGPGTVGALASAGLRVSTRKAYEKQQKKYADA